MKLIAELRKRRWIFLAKRDIRRDIKSARDSGSVNLNIGSGLIEIENWINLDLPVFDITSSKSWEDVLKGQTFDNVMLEHVFEHLTKEEITTALRLAREYMTPTSNIRIAVPDKNHPNEAYIEHVRPGGSGPGADDHKTFWNLEAFTALAEALNFDVKPIEYYTKDGELIMDELDPALGPIKRTARKPTSSHLPDYSSLIIDLKLK